MQNILIRNVTVIDQTGKTEDEVVSILIRDKKLKLVSRDKIELKEADIAFDAKGDLSLVDWNLEAWQDLLFWIRIHEPMWM